MLSPLMIPNSDEEKLRRLMAEGDKGSTGDD
jgi:hypothetical protein